MDSNTFTQTPFKNMDMISGKNLKINVIGFSGKIGSGKNYIGEQVLGKFLNDNGYRVHSLGFADQIKYEIAIRPNILMEEKLKYDKNEYENQMWEAGIINLFNGWMSNTNDFIYLTNCLWFYFKCSLNYLFPLSFKIINNKIKNIALLEDVVLNNKKNYNLVFKEKPSYVRLKLQEYAQEREINEYVWINSLHLRMMNILEKSYDKTKDVFIITDVRFKNEIAFVKDIGGVVVKIDKSEKNNFTKNNSDKINNHVSETELDDINCDFKIKNTFDENVNIENVISYIFG